MKSKLSTLLLLFAITLASAQGKKWSLQECVEYAVENNLTVEQFELDLESATLDKSDAIGALLPSFNGNAGIQERSGLVVNPNSNTNTTGTIFQFAPGVSSNVTLFDGLRNIHRLNRAKLTAIANQYRLDDLKDDIRLSVAQGYLRILSNKEALKVSRAQYAVTEQDLKRITELVDSGVVPRGELLDIEATSASQEQQIVNGESLVLISKISLAQLLQINDYENFDILDESFEIPDRFDFQQYIRHGFKVMHDELFTVRIMISPAWARYVGEKIWHESQMIQKHLDGAIEIIFRVAGLDEIKQWVLGLGPEAIVVEPEELKVMVQADLERSLDQYRHGTLFEVKDLEDGFSEKVKP